MALSHSSETNGRTMERPSTPAIELSAMSGMDPASIPVDPYASQTATVVHSEPDSPAPTVRQDVDQTDLERADSRDAKDLIEDQSNLLPRRQIIVVFLSLSAGCFMALLDQSIVATALPSINSDFKSGSTSTFVATAYLVTGCAVQPLYGRFSDIFGRRVMMISALSIFVLGSLACALAQSIGELIAFRAIAGVGGGAVMSLSMIIISDVVSLRQRGKYQGILGAVIALANGTGPLLGSAFSQHLTWRWCFWINLPIGAFAIAISAFVLPLRCVHGDFWSKVRRIDFLGSLLVLVGVVLMLLSLNWGGQAFSWSSAAVLATLLVGIAVMAAFVFWEGKGARLPIVPLHIFKNRTIVGVYITTVSLGVCFFIPLFYIPQFFQTARGYSAVSAGLTLLPLLIVQIAVSALSGFFVSKTGRFRPPLICGYTIWAVSNGLVSTFDQSTTVAKSVGYLILQGIGAGMTFQTSLVAAQAAAEKKDMAVVTSTRNFIRMLSGTLALAICSSIISNTLAAAITEQSLSPAIRKQILDDPTLLSHGNLDLSPTQRADLIAGYTLGVHVAFWIASGFCVVALASSVFLVQHQELVRSGEKEAKMRAKAWVEQRRRKRQARGLFRLRRSEEERHDERS